MRQEEKVEILKAVLDLINKCYQKEASLSQQFNNSETLRAFGSLLQHEIQQLPKEEEKKEEE